jgi:hypothetical protein
MRKVRVDEVLDLQAYESRREEIRKSAMAAKDRRRVHLGDHLTFLFENPETIRYQVQEMIRAERMHKPEDVQREVDTYNEILGGNGEIGATLMIEIDDPDERKQKLRAWRDLPDHLYARLQDGRLVRATFDPRQRGEDRLSAVQFVKFRTGGQVPVALGSDFPRLRSVVTLTPDQRKALEEDFAAQ